MAVPTKTPPVTYVALLRGVNVGGNNRLLMADLRAHFASLGYLEVRTFIQSGNVIFQSADAVRSEHLEAAIANQFDIVTPVVLRTAQQIAATARRNPFADLDRGRLHVGFPRQTPIAGAVAGLELEQFAPDQARVVQSDVYLYLPNGTARSKLATYVDRRLKCSMTVRNWNTVAQLHALTNA
jgi:uncharacterized protein (DUF1697 family)